MLEHTRLREDARFPFGYLDFDRAGLDVGDPLGLCMELLHQLDIQFPGDDRFADIRERAIAQWGDSAKVPPPESRLAAARGLLGDVVERMRQVLGSRPYVVVLDTFEEVQYRGEARAFPLWEMLIKLQDRAPFLRVVVAGRAPVESLQLAGRPPRQIALGELDDESAMAFLNAQGIPDRSLQERLVRTFGRVPLSLKLVGSLAGRTPGGAAGLLDPVAAGGSLVAASDELIQGQLYERILDHIADEQVRRLAHPGLVLRRINPLIIVEVLNEPCGLGIRTKEEAQQLFEQLQRETSLVSVDSSDGDLVHRADLRRVMLKMLLARAPAQVEQIRRRAVTFYARQRSRRGRAEELYHRLHLGEWIDDRELADREIRSSIQAAVEEFPLQVQLRLGTLGFDVLPEVREQATREQRDKSIASQIEELLPYGPSSEAGAQAILTSVQDDLRLGSPLFRAGTRIAAQRGYEQVALDLIERGLEGAVREGAAAQTLGLLQERAWLYRSRSRADQADGLALRRRVGERLGVAVHGQDRRAPVQQPPGRDRRVDSPRQQADHLAARAGRETAGAAVLAEEVERLVAQRFEMDGQLGMREVDRPAAGLLDPATHLALDFRRGERKPLVRAPRRDPERPALLIAEILQDVRRHRLDLQRRAPRFREVADPEHPRQPLAHHVPAGVRPQHQLDSPHQRPHRSHVEISGRRAQVANQLGDEPRAVLALEGDLLVVHDYGFHESCQCRMQKRNAGLTNRGTRIIW
jgi:hypothetical protein